MKLQGKHYFDIFWMLFFAVIMITSFGYHYKARLIPLVVTIPCLAFGIYRFFVDLKGEEESETGEDMFLHGIKDKVDEISAGTSVGYKQKSRAKFTKAEKKKRFFDTALWIVAFLVMIYVLGFLIAIPLFSILYMKIKKEGWVLSILCAAGIWAGVYLAFVVGTQSYIYEGLLIPLLRGQ